MLKKSIPVLNIYCKIFNPLNNNKLFIDFGTIHQESVPINLYNITGKLFFSNTYNLNSGILEMNISRITLFIPSFQNIHKFSFQ